MPLQRWGSAGSKCSLSSFAIPHRQTGLRQLKLCLNLCSYRTLNDSRNFEKCLTPIISFLPFVRFFSGLIIAINLRLKSEIDIELNKFYLNIEV